MRYGLLFNGYKDRLFYWEILVMLRKFSVVMVSQFLAVYSPEIQVLVLMILFCVIIYGAKQSEPFRIPALSQLELYSLFANLLFIYNGLFLVIGSHREFLKDSVILRILFLLLQIVPMFGYQIYVVKLMWPLLLTYLVRTKKVKAFRLFTCGKVDINEFIAEHNRRSRNQMRGYEFQLDEVDVGGQHS